MTQKQQAAVFWDEKPCTMGVINVSEEHTASVFRVEDGGSMLLRNIGNNLTKYMASIPQDRSFYALLVSITFLCDYFELLRRSQHHAFS
jgi:hypothetical protein